jgi:predicted N-acetyltransferase YhbS
MVMRAGPEVPPAARREEINRLLNAVLRSGRPATIVEEYPTALHPDNLENVRVIIDEDQVVSHVVSLPVDYHVDDVEFRVGVIGSVATHPDHRGRGHASACLRACEEAVRRAGGSVAILWAEDDAFYLRQGYVRAGREDLFVIPTRFLRRRNDRSGVRRAGPADADGIAEVHLALRARTNRAPDAWRAYLSIPRMTTLVYERDGRIVAYACCGKGADFEGVVHEWAGPTMEVLDLVLEHVLAEDREDIVLLSPPYTGRMRRILRDRALPAHTGALGMMKIVEPTRLAETIQSFTSARPEEATSVEALDDGRFRLDGPEGIFLLDGEQMLRTAFGAEVQEEPMIPGLPIPFYLRGLDSI